MKKLRTIFIEGLYMKNPVLGLFLGLSVAVLATTTLFNAVVVSLLVLVILIVGEFVVSLFRKHLNSFFASLIFVFIAASISTIASFLLGAYYPSIGLESYADFSNTLVTGLVPFIASSSIYVFNAKEALEYNPGQAFVDSFASGLGFLFALALIAFFREILATGELCFTLPSGVQSYVHLFDFTLPILGQPFGGLLFTGLFSGLHGCIVNRIKKAQQKTIIKG